MNTTLQTPLAPVMPIRPAATIAQRLTAGLVLTVIVIVALLNFLLYLRTADQIQRDLESRIATSADQLSGSLGSLLWNFDTESMARTAQVYADLEDITHVRIDNERGEMLFEDRDAPEDSAVIVAVRPILFEGREVGSLEIDVSAASIQRAQADSFISTVLSTVVIVMGIVLVNLVLVRRFLVRPLETLTRGLGTIAAGKYDQRLPAFDTHDLDEIGTSINDMAKAIAERDAQLRQSIETLEDRVTARTRDLNTALEEAKASRARAEEADRAKSTFLASMSHELRTPLNAIINFSKFLHRQLPGPLNEEQSGLVLNLVESGQHLLNLINDVLDMSKIESGSLRLYVEPDIDPVEVLAAAVKVTAPMLRDKPVTLYQSVEPDLPKLRCDKRRLLQILLNVLSNAAKFTDAGRIDVSMRASADDLHITIQDTGAGIAEADKQFVFTAFKQTESGLRGGMGTGLGMPITQRLVEAHHGRIWFESTIGVGTTFHIEIPIAPPIGVTAEMQRVADYA